MSLRNNLAATLGAEGQKLRVAFAKERNCATQPENAQPPAQPERNNQAGNPRQSSVSGATVSATAAQQTSCASPSATVHEHNQVAQLRCLASATRNFGPLTAHRVGSALADSINTACDLRGDDEANRAGLLEECRALSADAQLDMLGHFDQVTDIWATATGVVLPFPRGRRALLTQEFSRNEQMRGET
jgi:hypothetical protein